MKKTRRSLNLLGLRIASFWVALALAGAASLAVCSAQAEEKLKTVDRPGKAVETVTLEASATMLNGSPVPGVKVTFYDFSFGQRGDRRKEHSWAGITDEKGHLRIEAPAEEVSVSASCRILPDAAAKFAPCSISMPQAAFASSNLSRKAAILLGPATGGIKGVVTGADGKPIPGVAIDLALTGDHSTCAYKATTDNDGRYSVAGLAAGRYTVSSVAPPAGSHWIRLAGWKMRQEVSVGEGKTASQDFKLTPGARIKGRVLDDAGKPVGGALVSCDLDSATEVGPKQMYQLPGQWYGGEAQTDNAGAFTLGALTQETYRVRVQPPEGSAWAWTEVRGVNALEGQDTALQDIVLSKGASILGLAVGPDGRPIGGAEAVLSPGGREDTKTCDENGRFTFKGLPTGMYTISVHPPEGGKWCPKAMSGIAAIRGFCVEPRVELPLGASLSGKVTGPGGEPLEGALVYLNYTVGKGGYAGGHWKAATDRAGQFSIFGLGVPPDCESGGAWQLVIRPPPAALELKDISTPLEAPAPGKQVEKNVQLSAGLAAISGVVCGPDGKPLAGCRMAVVRIKGRGSCTGICYALKKSDAEGRFTIGQIEPDSWSITAEPPENSDLVPLLEAARSLKAGVASINVTLKKGAALVGKILTTTGQPLVAAEIRAQMAARDRVWIPSIAENRLPVRTSADGTFRLPGLPAGQYQVSCHPANPDYGATEASVTVPAVGEVEAKISAFRVCGVHGRVTGAELSQGAFLVFASQDAQAEKRANVKADGEFRIAHLAPGKYSLKLASWRAGKQSFMVCTPKEVSLKEGEELELQVNAEKGGAEPPEKAGTF